MRNNKNIFLALASVAVLGLSSVSCTKEYVAPNDLADLTWVISLDQNSTRNVNPIITSLRKMDSKINGTDSMATAVSVMDASQGYLSHDWYVSNDGTYLMSNLDNIDLPYSISDYNPLIDTSIPHDGNTDATVNVLFTRAGEHTIRLRNTFGKMVSYESSPYSNATGAYVQKHYTKKEGDIFVMDTTFVVDVYDNTLKPGAEVYLDKALTQRVESDELSVGLGQTIYVKDMSYYKPNLYKFESVDAEISIEQSIPVGEEAVFPLTFNKLSSADQTFIIKHTVTRELDPTNAFVPTAAAKTDTIRVNNLPLKISVGLSSPESPVEVNSLVANFTTQNQVSVIINNGPFDAESLPGQFANFNLHIKNDYNGATLVEKNIQPTLVSVDPTNPNALLLDFAEMIYNTDYLTLTYTKPAEGGVMAESSEEGVGRPLTLPEEGLTLEPSADTIIDSTTEGFNFDEMTTNQLQEYWYIAPEQALAGAVGNISIVRFPDENFDEKCMKIEAIKPLVRLYSSQPVVVPAGVNYKFGAEVWIDSSTTTTVAWVALSINKPYNGNDDVLHGINPSTGAARTHLGSYPVYQPGHANEYRNALWQGQGWLPGPLTDGIAHDGPTEFTSGGSTLADDRRVFLDLAQFKGVMYVKNFILSNAQERPRE